MKRREFFKSASVATIGAAAAGTRDRIACYVNLTKYYAEWYKRFGARMATSSQSSNPGGQPA